MIPQLTEAWAAAYLQSTIMLLVFALGLPAVIFEVAISKDLAYVIQRNRWIRRTPLVVVAAAYGIIALCFVWPFHPCATWHLPLIGETAAHVLMVAAILASPWPWFYVRRVASFKRVVDTLGKEVRLSIASKGVHSESKLDDLGYLGNRAKGGDDKQHVLQVLSQLAEAQLKSTSYSGTELAHLLAAIETTLCSTRNPASDEDFIVGLRIYQSALRGLWHTGLGSSSDFEFVRQSLSRLGGIVCAQKNEPTGLEYLQANTGFSLGLLRIGMTAISMQKFLIMEAALSKLELLLESPAQPQVHGAPETPHHYVGFLGFMHGSGLREVQQRAVDSLTRELSHLGGSPLDALRAAQTFFLSTAQYEVAAAIRRFIEYYSKRADEGEVQT